MAAPTVGWHLGHAFGVFLFALVVTAAVVPLGFWVFRGQALTEADTERTSVMLVSQLGMVSSFFLGAYVVCRTRGSGSLTRDLRLRFRPIDLVLGVGAAIAGHVLVFLMYLPFADADEKLGKLANNLFQDRPGWEIAAFALTAAVLAPLAEELVFRGLVQQSLSRISGPLFTVVGTAVLFGLAHFNPFSFFGLAAFGALLSILTLRSNRLGPAIVAHVVFNAVTVASVLLT